LGGYIGNATGAALGPSIVARLIAAGVPAAQAAAIAGGVTAPIAGGFASAVTPSLARAPLGTVVFNDPTFGANPDLIATYQSVSGQVWIYGVDAAFQYLMDDNFTLSGTVGGINRNIFREYKDASGLPLESNSPKFRGSMTLRYQQEPENGFGAELRGRYSDAFSVNSGVYNTGYCNIIAPGNPGALANATGGPQEAFGGTCPAGTFRYNEQFGSIVPVNIMFDAGITYRFDIAGKRALWSLTVNNMFDNKVPTFAGVPNIGRLAMTRLSYSF
jgi:outer membrane receptor for ferrienterochelin and colicins